MIEFRSALARLGLFLDHWDTASSKVIKPHTGRQRSAALLAHMYRRGIGNAIDLKEAYAWSEVAAVEGNSTERQARDQLLYSLTFDDQGEALRRADQIFDAIKLSSRQGLAGDTEQPMATIGGAQQNLAEPVS